MTFHNTWKFSSKSPFKQSLQKFKCFFKRPIRTIGIEVEPMLVKDNLKISLWDLGGQDEFHAFHDLVVPSLNDNGAACFFILLCKILCNENSNNEKHMDEIEKELQYWLRFIFSNERLLITFKPFVRIAFTHVENEPNFHKCQIIQKFM